MTVPAMKKRGQIGLVLLIAFQSLYLQTRDCLQSFGANTNGRKRPGTCVDSRLEQPSRRLPELCRREALHRHKPCAEVADLEVDCSE